MKNKQMTHRPVKSTESQRVHFVALERFHCPSPYSTFPVVDWSLDHPDGVFVVTVGNVTRTFSVAKGETAAALEFWGTRCPRSDICCRGNLQRPCSGIASYSVFNFRETSPPA